MKTRERLVFFYDLTISSKSRDSAISQPSCTSIREAIEAISATKPTNAALARKSSELIEISDWKFDSISKTYQILINRADRSLADPAFKDFKTRKVRAGGKTKDEGIDVSTHIVIVVPTVGKTALALVTYGAGVTAAVLQKLFKQLMKSAKSNPKNNHLFNFKDPSGANDQNGKPITYEVDYEFSCSGHQGQTLKDDIDAGRLLSVDLITESTAKFDTNGNLQVRRQILEIKPVNAFKVSMNSLINAIKEKRKVTTINAARIRFKDADGKPREESFSIDSLETAFTRKQHIDFDSDLPSQSAKIDKTIIDAMIEIL